MPDATGKCWYLVQCKPRQAPRALEHLERQGFQCLLPLHHIQRRHKGQLKQVVEPLFPGYLFINLDKVDDNWLPIRSTRGVSHIVSFGGRPTTVPLSVIERLLQLDTEPANNPPLASGDRVSIVTPGLEQVDAIFLEHDGEGRVLLLLQLLQRQVHTRVPLSWIEKELP
jgi:transcriptional antiterminator RfaH